MFILASTSKSRKKILDNCKLQYICKKPRCNEEIIKKKLMKKSLDPEKISLRLAMEKAKSISRMNKKIIVVGSDTVIDFEGSVIDKAKNMSEAYTKIEKLSGKKHTIISSAAAYFDSKLVWKVSEKTLVFIKCLEKKEIKKYLKIHGRGVLESAGCYKIENQNNLIEKIEGDFFNVMGFPLFPFLNFLTLTNNKKNVI
ncbi:MAG: Septum formation protein Maf [Alphaproteobacteria bacterium MarineAlpha5_Bin9]|nr:MAG: Septum formation protein Maf [Alphaproteobacteria bacterium MarineAlpha5_Bin9]|tara:strand:+ start:28730 stop:29323 length:594 start_codon:yes stop_codon:yes gene_type:complete